MQGMQPSPDAPGTGARLRELSRLAVSTLRVAAPSGRGKGGGASVLDRLSNRALWKLRENDGTSGRVSLSVHGRVSVAPHWSGHLVSKNPLLHGTPPTPHEAKRDRAKNGTRSRKYNTHVPVYTGSALDPHPPSSPERGGSDRRDRERRRKSAWKPELSV